MDPARPILVPHSLHISVSHTWSPVSEHVHLVRSTEPACLSLVLGGLQRETGGRGDFRSICQEPDALSGPLSP